MRKATNLGTFIKTAFWLFVIVATCWVTWNLAQASWSIQGSYRGRSGGLVPFLFFLAIGGVAVLYAFGKLVAVFVSPKPRASIRSRRR